MSRTLPPAGGTRPRAAVVVACLALFTDMLVYGLAIPVLPLLDATVQAGPLGSSVLFAGYAATMIIVTPVAGLLVDRHGPRSPLLVGLVGLAAATVLFAFGGPFWLLLVGRLLQGLAAGMSWVASLALIAAVIPFSRRGRVMGMAMSMIALGTLIGPPLSGLLVAHLGTASPFVLAAVLALLDGALRVVFIRPLPPSSDDPTGPLSVLRVPGSWSVVGVVCLSAAVISAIQPVLPQYLHEMFRLDAFGIGLLFALLVIVGIVLNPLVGGLVGRVDARVLVGSGVVLAAAGFTAVAAGGLLWHVALGAGLIGASVALFSAPSSTLIGVQGEQTTPPALGGAYSLYNLAYAMGLMIGPAVSGGLLQAVGPRPAYAGLAVATVLGGTVAAARLPRATTGRRAVSGGGR